MMKRKLTGISTLVLALTILVFMAACSKNSNTGNSNSGNSSNTSGSTKPSTGSTTTAGMSPTEVFKAYYDAAVKRDFASAKKYLSQGTIALMEEGAKKQGKTFEEAMKESPAPEGNMPSLSNEQISGDTATVDITADGKKAAMPFVKEGGEWKIALDKFAADLMGGSGNGPSTGDGEVRDNDNH
ncbi:MAG: hypothetical protein QOH63_191 [Acidobacteriota bacterium]|nr:hypothetical protein [Acidobacteriota bacterium]